MEIRKLTTDDAKQFSELIVDMYANLTSIEWFSPMPFKENDVAEIISKPRFYIVGAFDNNFLCAVASLDYKCGKLIGKIDFPKECDTDKLVEFGFTMVHSKYRGQGIMKTLVAHLIEVAKSQGLEWGFGKVHKDNLASSTSMIRKGFYKTNDYNKPVKIEEIQSLINDKVLNETATKNILAKISKNDDKDFIYVDYEILMKKL